MTAKQVIEAGKAVLGIEFGSTRIKAVLIDEDNKPIAQGSHEWENQLVDGLWTYSTEAIWYGLQDCYAELRKDVLKQYDCEIEALGAIGSGNPDVVHFLVDDFLQTTDYVTRMVLLRVIHKYGSIGLAAYNKLKSEADPELQPYFAHIECDLIDSRRYA